MPASHRSPLSSQHDTASTRADALRTYAAPAVRLHPLYASSHVSGRSIDNRIRVPRQSNFPSQGASAPGAPARAPAPAHGAPAPGAPAFGLQASAVDYFSRALSIRGQRATQLRRPALSTGKENKANQELPTEIVGGRDIDIEHGAPTDAVAP